MGLSTIFEGWEDDKFSQVMTYIICAGILGLAVLLSLSGTVTTNVFFYLTLMAILIAIGEFTGAGNYFGSKNKTMIGYVAGVALGLLMGLSTRNGSYSLILPTLSLLDLGNLSFLFVNIIAPIAEPLFFRGLVYPFVLQAVAGSKTDADWKQKILAVVISAYLFGFYHVFAYYQNTGGNFLETFGFVSYAAFFGVLFIGATTFMGSVSIEIGWHFVNNLFAQQYTVAQIIPTTIAFSAVFLVVCYLFGLRWGDD